VVAGEGLGDGVCEGVTRNVSGALRFARKTEQGVRLCLEEFGESAQSLAMDKSSKKWFEDRRRWETCVSKESEGGYVLLEDGMEWDGFGKREPRSTVHHRKRVSISSAMTGVRHSVSHICSNGSSHNKILEWNFSHRECGW
jgi:hypothetical protein